MTNVTPYRVFLFEYHVSFHQELRATDQDSSEHAGWAFDRTTAVVRIVAPTAYMARDILDDQNEYVIRPEHVYRIDDIKEARIHGVLLSPAHRSKLYVMIGSGKIARIVAPNERLAKREVEWMQPFDKVEEFDLAYVLTGFHYA